MSLRPTREIEKEKRELVAEQQGFTWMLLAIGMAFFLGLLFKGSLSSQRLEQLMKQAASNVHKDVEISFDSVKISLADGVWPELAIVINDIKLDSQQVCWLSPELMAHEVKLPLEISALFSGRISIKEIVADQVVMNLRSDYSLCSKRAPSSEDKKVSGDIDGNKDADKANLESVSKIFFENIPRDRNAIESLDVKSFKLKYLPNELAAVEIVDLKVDLKSKEPKEILIGGFLNLGNQAVTADFSSQARLEIHYLENPSPIWNARFSGNWREGQYRLQAQIDPISQMAKLEATSDHIPLKQILPLLKKYKVIHEDFDGKNVWVSLHAKSETDLKKEKIPLDIGKFKFEGDLGEFDIEKLHFNNIKTGEFDPFSIEIQSLNFEAFNRFLNRERNSKSSLGQLGVFRGRVFVKSTEDVKIEGEHSGLEFIFSSQSVRQVQSIALIAGQAELKNKVWNVKIDRIRPSEGLFLGKVNIKSDHAVENLEIDLDIEDLTLAPEIQKLMTAGGQMASLAGKLNLKTRKSELVALKGWLDAPDVHLAGAHIYRPKIVFNSTDNKNLKSNFTDINTRIMAKKVEVAKNSVILDWSAPFLEKSNLSNEDYNMDGLNLSFDKLANGKSYWRLKKIKLNSNRHDYNPVFLSSEGQWTMQGILEGDIRLESKNKIYNILLTGNRDEPQFELLRSKTN
jgi:hypothetical protein